MNTLKFDLIIVGGGVAGLWLLNKAVNAGLSAILLEKNELGGGQTICAQGIIHGGTKYALNGVLTQASNTIKAMPQRWKDCLDGHGEIDLSAVEQLSDAHYMWSKGSLSSKMTTFFATKAFRGRVEEVKKADRPTVFQHKAFKGSLYRLNEIVLNVPSLINALRAPVAERIYQADIETATFNQSPNGIAALEFPDKNLRLEPGQLVLTAGEGIESITGKLKLSFPEMQRRPLHMVMVKHDYDLPTFAHCIGTGSKPIATITTHPCEDGKHVWYLGGDIAETGVQRDTVSQIKFAQKAMADLLPWVDLSQAQWRTFHINRAEPKQSALTRPDSAFAHQSGNCIIAWPTKLALSPDLADQILPLCQKGSAGSELSALHSFSQPKIAQPAWEIQF
ncbi:MAG: FAD-dependent oxidoreductase [Neptuniibacter caesariensis]|uniref:FAD-dependent oxidoreductase n=1 Tax=Neptuniibacter caesariensis TaxID=207954 RepID=A0A2G6JAZ6_NEPCE|nr:MAG: FAD-dependent oxidoreductase [Neptuniibacter caesariensis]